MSEQWKPTLKGRLLAFGASALICALIIEGGARLFESKNPPITHAWNLIMRPYMMFTPITPTHPVWYNIGTASEIQSRMTFNNLGFMGDINFTIPPNPEFLKSFERGPKERLVLITGGSVVHGVGATANDKTIAGQLEAILNSRQTENRYRVVNLGMGSWISYQQFVGLSLFGLPLKPDWIVVMDGHNDAVVACPHGAGVGNPMGWPQVLYMTGGGEGTGAKNPVLQWAVDHTAIARVLTGRQAQPASGHQLDRLETDESDPDARFRIKLRDLTLAELDRQVDFYVQAQDGVKELFSNANVLFSTQPVLHNNAISPAYRKAFDPRLADQEVAIGKQGLREALDAYMAKTSTTKCTNQISSQALGYFLARSALRLDQAAQKWLADSKTRSIRYANTEMLFPASLSQRLPNFVDNAHMSDLGQRRVAEYFAGYILEVDMSLSFSPAALATNVRTEAFEAYWPQAQRFPYQPPPAPIPASSPATFRKDNVVIEEPSPGVLKIIESKEAGRHIVVWEDMRAVAGKDKVLTIDVWSDSVPSISFEVLDGPSKYGSIQVDLPSHRVISSAGPFAAQVRDLGKGWRQLAVQIPASETALTLTLGLLSDGDEHSYLGSGRSIAATRPVLAVKSN
jgi:lysophospholipase L1-like esterase